METPQLSCTAVLIKLDAHAGHIQIEDCFLLSYRSVPATTVMKSFLKTQERAVFGNALLMVAVPTKNASLASLTQWL